MLLTLTHRHSPHLLTAEAHEAPPRHRGPKSRNSKIPAQTGGKPSPIHGLCFLRLTDGPASVLAAPPQPPAPPRGSNPAPAWRAPSRARQPSPQAPVGLARPGPVEARWMNGTTGASPRSARSSAQGDRDGDGDGDRHGDGSRGHVPPVPRFSPHPVPFPPRARFPRLFHPSLSHPALTAPGPVPRSLTRARFSRSLAPHSPIARPGSPLSRPSLTHGPGPGPARPRSAPAAAWHRK